MKTFSTRKVHIVFHTRRFYFRRFHLYCFRLRRFCRRRFRLHCFVLAVFILAGSVIIVFAGSKSRTNQNRRYTLSCRKIKSN